MSNAEIVLVLIIVLVMVGMILSLFRMHLDHKALMNQRVREDAAQMRIDEWTRLVAERSGIKKGGEEF